MKPRKIDKFTPAPPGMNKVHIEYYMAYPKASPKLSKNVTVRKKKAGPTKKKKKAGPAKPPRLGPAHKAKAASVPRRPLMNDVT